MHGLVWFGQAALYFHEKQYGASRQILHTLFARIEVLDEALGVQVCNYLRPECTVRSCLGCLPGLSWSYPQKLHVETPHSPEPLRHILDVNDAYF